MVGQPAQLPSVPLEAASVTCDPSCLTGTQSLGALHAVLHVLLNQGRKFSTRLPVGLHYCLCHSLMHSDTNADWDLCS